MEVAVGVWQECQPCSVHPLNTIRWITRQLEQLKVILPRLIWSLWRKNIPRKTLYASIAPTNTAVSTWVRQIAMASLLIRRTTRYRPNLVSWSPFNSRRWLCKIFNLARSIIILTICSIWMVKILVWWKDKVPFKPCFLMVRYLELGRKILAIILTRRYYNTTSRLTKTAII